MEERKDEIPKREKWLHQLFQGAKAPNPYFYAALKEIRRQGQNRKIRYFRKFKAEPVLNFCAADHERTLARNQ